jgi:hypothetical protein
MKIFARTATTLCVLWLGLGTQLIASPGVVAPRLSNASLQGAGLSTRYALAGIGAIGDRPFVVLLDRVRGVPIVLNSLDSSEDRVALEMVGRGYIRLRIDGRSHELAFTSGSEGRPPRTEKAVSSLVSTHLKRQDERRRALLGHGNYRN